MADGPSFCGQRDSVQKGDFNAITLQEKDQPSRPTNYYQSHQRSNGCGAPASFNAKERRGTTDVANRGLLVSIIYVCIHVHIYIQNIFLYLCINIQNSEQ